VKLEDLQQAADLYFARIHRAALILTGNPWDADDLAQETFLVLARDADSFAGRSSLYTWLYGILLNLERRWRRSRSTRQKALRVLSEQQDVLRPIDCAPPEARLEAAEWSRSLWELVDRLPEPQRVVLVLRFAGELRYEEIAEVLGCPLGTVKSRIHHGLLGLRTLLAKAGKADVQSPNDKQPAAPDGGLAAADPLPEGRTGGISRVV
jgi:RNA polymerase sigma-70 factor (ECF subfamily)